MSQPHEAASGEETIVVVGKGPEGQQPSSSEPQDLPEVSQGPPEAVLAMGDFPLEGLRGKGPTEGAESTASSSEASSWMPVPEAICVYHQRGSCLRLNCRYFHGSAEQLAELQATGATHYRFDPRSKIEVPKPGEEISAVDEHGIGIRFADEGGKSKRKKPIVCLAFLSGTCRRPDCRFTHLPPNVRPLPTTACSYFSVGTCKRGTCRYFHGTEEELNRIKSQGATMYNPLTNEPYERIPDFDEPQRPDSRASNSSGGSASGDGRRGSSGVKKQQPPTYQLVVPSAGMGVAAPQPTQVVYIAQPQPTYPPQGMVMMGPQPVLTQPMYQPMPTPMPMYPSTGFYPGMAAAPMLAPVPMAMQPGMTYMAPQQAPVWVAQQPSAPAMAMQPQFVLTHQTPYQ